VSLKGDFTKAKEELAAKRVRLAEMYQAAEKETDDAKRAEVYDGIKQANAELADLVDKIEPLGELVRAEEDNARALKALRQPVSRQVDDDQGPEGQEVS